MTLRQAAAILAACLVAGCASAGISQSAKIPPVRLLVQAAADTTLEQFDELLRTYGARRVAAVGQINVHVVQVPAGVDARAVAEALSKNPRIRFAEVDERVPADYRHSTSAH